MAIDVPSADATVVRRESIVSGDTVLADVLVPGEIDEYVFLAPRGAVAEIAFGKVPPGNWKTALGLFDFDYRSLTLSGTTPTVASTPVPIATSGQMRLLFSSAGTSVGGYRFKFKLTPQRSFAATGTGTAAAAPLVVGAAAGSELTVTLRWRGASPVTLTSLVGPSGPLTSSKPPVVKGPSSIQAGFVTTAFGDQTASIDVPVGTKSWSLKVAVKPPAPVHGTVRDLRAGGPEERPAVELRNTADTVVVVVRDEQGGPNDVVIQPGATVPGIRLLDLRATGCGGAAIDGGDTPGSYRYVCANGFRAELRNVVRAGGRIVGFDAVELVSPLGTGSSVLSDCVFDAGGLPVSWTEVRTFDASGSVHRIEVSDVVRNAGGTVLAYSVVHTPRGGVPRRYDYAPLRGN